MINILAGAWFLTTMIALWLFIVFMFDHLVLDGMLKDKLKSWLQEQLADSCNQDCEQGRCCTCKSEKYDM